MSRVYPARTVLAQRIRERRLTLEEFSDQLELFARENNEVGTVSIRHVQRLAAGQLTSDQLRPATARLLERYFGSPIEELLVSPETKDLSAQGSDLLAQADQPGSGGGGRGAWEAPANPNDQERMVTTVSPWGNAAKIGGSSNVPTCGNCSMKDSKLSGIAPWGVMTDPYPASVEPIDEEFIANLRTRMQELLTLDAQVGGNETSTQALRLFRSVHRRIGASSCPKYLRRDLYATVGELAEIAGWLFYDADQQDAMRRINHEALYYLRWTGHRSLELLTLQNISMQAEYLNRPSEALHIVQSVLEAGRLSPRIESLFLARGAHALAQQQQRTEALRSFRKATALYLDGPRDDDPAWAYWVDERQFAWFEAVLYAELGERDKPAAIFAEALATSPKHRIRGIYSRSVYLFESLVNAGDWQEAEQLVSKLAPYISEVGSGRTASILRKTLHAAQKADTTSTLDDGVRWLRELMKEV
jgi:tetratricopeptide (TPR) repeat protein